MRGGWISRKTLGTLAFFSILSLTPPGVLKYLELCPRSAERKPTNPVRTPQVAAVSAVIVAAGRLGHFPSENVNKTAF